MKHVARKRFGQNFLTDKLVLDNIIDAIGPEKGQAMVEIGPGLAAMTALLLKRLDHMHVVELDRDLVARLENNLPAREADHPLGRRAQVRLRPDSGAARAEAAGWSATCRTTFRARCCSTWPTFAHLIEDQHFMLQKEVVERMVAAPGSKVYGRLSVMLQWRYDMSLMFIVPPTAFDPPPQVESAIVRMVPTARKLACDGPTLEAVVMKAFSQRRKVIRNCVAGMFTEAQLIEAGIDPSTRPETVSLEQYVALSNLLKQPA